MTYALPICGIVSFPADVLSHLSLSVVRVPAAFYRSTSTLHQPLRPPDSD